MQTRREFLESAGVVLLLVPVAACSGGSGSSSSGSCDGVSSTSSVAQGHTHTVCVPMSDLSSPPSGGATYTTSGPDPTHMITLSQQQLSTIDKGQSVMVTTTTNGNHNHTFNLSKPQT